MTEKRGGVGTYGEDNSCGLQGLVMTTLKNGNSSWGPEEKKIKSARWTKRRKRWKSPLPYTGISKFIREEKKGHTERGSLEHCARGRQD